MKNAKHIVFITGEPSGDMRGASIVKALKKMHPSLKCSGIGGSNMQAAGLECFDTIDNLAVIGFTEVIKGYGRIKQVFDNALNFIKKNQPDAVIFIDYPSFNLKLSKKVKKLGIKTIYYISPKVWAWKEHRIKVIQKNIDKMIVIFPFEVDFYKHHDINVTYVGHPLIDEMIIDENRETVLLNNNLDVDKKTIGLLPGSRKNEIIRHLPILIESAKILLEKKNHYQFLLFRTKELDDSLYDNILQKYNFPVASTHNYYSGLTATHACIVASGTATLEVGLLQKPMVVMYKISPLSYAIMKRMIKIKFASLVNIVLNRLAVNEFLQDMATPKNLANEILTLTTNYGQQTKMEQDFLEMKHLLGDGGASQRAAKVILDTLT